MPEFRVPSIDPESGLQFFGAIIATVHIIEVGAVEPAMHEEQLSVRSWLGVFEIRSHIQWGEHVAPLLVTVHPPFADAVSCPSGAPELIQDAPEFGCDVAQTRRGDPFCTANNCPGLYQVTNLSQHRARHVLTARI